MPHFPALYSHFGNCSGHRFAPLARHNETQAHPSVHLAWLTNNKVAPGNLFHLRPWAAFPVAATLEQILVDPCQELLPHIHVGDCGTVTSNYVIELQELHSMLLALLFECRYVAST